MKTPISDFCKNYAKKQSVRLHMPGGKGKNNQLDITEIDGADSLYSPNGIIKESMENASRLFGTAKTLYSVEGSSQVIRAMLYLCKIATGKSKVLALRNTHFSFISACALLDIDIDWLYFGAGVMESRLCDKDLDEKLASQKDLPACVYVTSPDYLGNILDIESISKVCKKYGVLLVCDNAHGSYLKFLSTDLHPITLGADMCSDSAHKTLCSLTGGAYLHISKNAGERILSESENSMLLFGSTSPSYLILQSLDELNSYIYQNGNAFLQTENLVQMLKNLLTSNGYTVTSCEPFKITVYAKDYGYFGSELYTILQNNNIECEYFDDDYVVMMFSTENDAGDFDKVFSVLSSILKKPKIEILPPKIVLPKKVMSVKDAVFSKKKKVDVASALGQTLAFGGLTCPPCVLICAPGEVVSSEVISLYNYYGIKNCFIVEK